MKYTKFLIILILVLMVLNIKATFGFLWTMKPQDIFHQRVRHPGAEFIPLRPYLNGVAFAGYDSDSRTASPFTSVAFAYPFQSAQFILSPTLIDYAHYADHKYIILKSNDPHWLDRKISELDATIVKDAGRGVVLIKRDRL